MTTPTPEQIEAFEHLVGKRKGTPYDRAKALALSPMLAHPEAEHVGETSAIHLSVSCSVFQCLEITLRADGTYDVAALGG